MISHDHSVTDQRTARAHGKLYGGWVHVFSARGDYNFLDSSCYFKKSLLVYEAFVSGMEISLGIKNIPSLLLLVQVAHEHITASDTDLSFSSLVRIENPYSNPRHRTTGSVKSRARKLMESSTTGSLSETVQGKYWSIRLRVKILSFM